jgi:ABC-type lipoprotein export system ATPase subunit
MTAAVDVRDAFRIFRSKAGATVALDGLTLAVEPGEVVAVYGRSGSGKTTLLRIVAGLERLSAGSASVFATELARLNRRAIVSFRARNLGFLDQHYARALSPDLSCRATVALQLRLLGHEPGESGRIADQLLERVGLLDRRNDPPATLSGGEQQRVAVCAAIAHRPRLVLADEPAGELDAGNAALIYELLGELARDVGAAVLIVSHDPAAAEISDRVVHIRDGRLAEQSVPGHPSALVVSRGGWVRLPDRRPSEADRPALLAAERRGNALLLRPIGSGAGNNRDGVLAAAPRPARTAAAAGGTGAELRHVAKSYRNQAREHLVFADLSRTFRVGAFVAVVGRSGSGKSTLLHLLAGLERPTAGEVTISGESLAGKGRSQLAALRRRHVALVTQDPGLVPHLSAVENVALGLSLRQGAREANAERALEEVGLAERRDQRASLLSAGERQRVAIARAVAADVSLLLVDEPTARLDEETGRAAGEQFVRAAHENGLAVICATHDPILIELADDVVFLERAGDAHPHPVAANR